jgi:capsid assembly protease
MSTNISTILSSPWAITRPAFDNVQAAIARHAAGESADIAALEAAMGKPLNNTRSPMAVTPEGVAIIALDGILTKRINLLTQISGGTSTQIAGDQLAQALADPAVSSIVLAIDSPGGTVDGTQALAEAVFAARGRKPITAVVDGMGASAAYWIASAADKVFISGDTTLVGSVGVIASHTDVSGAEAARGVKVSEIVAGKLKNATSSHAPLSATGREVIQGQVDSIYKTFLSDVARNRGVSTEKAHKEMADGRVFIGKDAINAGLADGVDTLQSVIKRQAAAVPAPVAAKRILSPGDLGRLAHVRVAEARALGYHLSFAAAIQAASES